MDRKDHGEARAGLITASVASTIMSGGEGAWETLIRNLWADDGTEFAIETKDARGYGLAHECVGRSLFWERHPQFEVDDPKFIAFSRTGFAAKHPYRRLLACSPDMGVLREGKRWGGGEIKSPTTEDAYSHKYLAYTSRNRIPPEHVDQVFFSLWVSGWDNWAFVAHFESRYTEVLVSKFDETYSKWLVRFRPKLDAFLAAYTDGEKAERDKLSASSLASLLRM